MTYDFTKEIFFDEEVMAYLNITKSALDKMCSRNQIRYSKPNRKRYFRKEDVIAFALQNPVKTFDELSATVITKNFRNKVA